MAVTEGLAKPPQVLQLTKPGAEAHAGLVTITMPMDVDLFSRVCAPLGKKGYVIGFNRPADLPRELENVHDCYLPMALDALAGLRHEDKQTHLAKILLACGGALPDDVDVP